MKKLTICTCLLGSACCLLSLNALSSMKKGELTGTKADVVNGVVRYVQGENELDTLFLEISPLLDEIDTLGEEQNAVYQAARKGEYDTISVKERGLLMEHTSEGNEKIRLATEKILECCAQRIKSPDQALESIMDSLRSLKIQLLIQEHHCDKITAEDRDWFTTKCGIAPEDIGWGIYRGQITWGLNVVENMRFYMNIMSQKVKESKAAEEK